MTTPPDTFAKIPDVSSWEIVFCFDFKGLLSFQAIIYVLTALRDFFSTLGTVLEWPSKAGMLDEDGNMPGIQKPFLVDAIGTCVGACTGNTTITTFVESTSGVGGGRQNRPDQYCGSPFSLLSWCSFALILMIPTQPLAPALIFVGFLMVSGIRNIDFSDFTEAFRPVCHDYVCYFLRKHCGGNRGRHSGIYHHQDCHG